MIVVLLCFTSVNYNFRTKNFVHIFEYAYHYNDKIIIWNNKIRFKITPSAFSNQIRPWHRHLSTPKLGRRLILWNYFQVLFTDCSVIAISLIVESIELTIRTGRPIPHFLITIGDSITCWYFKIGRYGGFRRNQYFCTENYWLKNVL